MPDATPKSPPFPSILPGAWLGILGGGQLGRMTAMAAAALGYRVHVFDPDADSPAAEVAARQTCAAFDDESALARFAACIDVATYEFENIPIRSATFLAERVPLRPGLKPLEIAQDRVREKTFLNGCGAPTAPFLEIGSAAELCEALETLGRPAILKTATLGYDGKGQVMITATTDPSEAYAAMGAERGILEGFVDFDREISVILARQGPGIVKTFDVVENRHEHHILDTTVAPAAIPPAAATIARELAERVAEALDLVGLLAVEMFVTRDKRILVNEIAPRPHNSGHWSLDACLTSQFEQFVRAICGLPLGNPERHSNAVMRNLLGDDVGKVPAILQDPDAKLHLYGKKEARPGRKMGHVTRLYPKEDPEIRDAANPMDVFGMLGGAKRPGGRDG